MTLYRAGVEPLRKPGDEMRLRNHLRWRTERAFVRVLLIRTSAPPGRHPMRQ